MEKKRESGNVGKFKNANETLSTQDSCHSGIAIKSRLLLAWRISLGT